jgi:hypothetical protein
MAAGSHVAERETTIEARLNAHRGIAFGCAVVMVWRLIRYEGGDGLKVDGGFSGRAFRVVEEDAAAYGAIGWLLGGGI